MVGLVTHFLTASAVLEQVEWVLCRQSQFVAVTSINTTTVVDLCVTIIYSIRHRTCQQIKKRP